MQRQSVKNFGGGVVVSQEIGRRSRTAKRRLPTNTSNACHTSSKSGKSIVRKSTASDAQEVTGFAIYVKNFFSNIFGCCGGGGQSTGTGNTDPSAKGNSANNSMHMPDYTFLPVPNGTNSVSLDSNNTK